MFLITISGDSKVLKSSGKLWKLEDWLHEQRENVDFVLLGKYDLPHLP